MDYEALLDAVVALAHRLQQCGAETFRVEESVSRILQAYECQAEVFAIPNCLIVSLHTPDGRIYTRMRRAVQGGLDLDSIERYNALSRKLCAEAPPLDEVLRLLDEVEASRKRYRLSILMVAYFFATAGFCLFYGGTLLDGLCAGCCGLAVGLCLIALGAFHVNSFFSTIASGFVMSLLACVLGRLGLLHNVDLVTIGALMPLVPGMLFTNAIRDIIFGDTNSGINRLVQVLMIAIGICVGTGAAMAVTRSLWGPLSAAGAPAQHSLIVLCISCFIGCAGFCVLFNIHGPGILLCCLGGCCSWLVLRLTTDLGASVLVGNFLAAMFLALYAEITARIRKYPAASYLAVALFPLVPGAGIYYTLDHLIQGNMEAFSATGMETAGVAGCLAVGVLLVSSAFRMYATWRHHKFTGRHGLGLFHLHK